MFTYRQASSRRWLAAAVPGRLVVWERGGAVVPATIWSMLRDEGIGPVLLQFAGTDLYSCPPFALVEWKGELGADAEARVLLKGPYDFTALTDAGLVQLNGEGKLTWLEHTLTGVLGFSVRCGAEPDGEPELPLGDGVAWVAGVSAGTLQQPAGEDASTASLGVLAPAVEDASIEAPTSEAPVAEEPVIAAPVAAGPVVAEPQRDYDELFNAIRNAEESASPVDPDRELESVPFDGAREADPAVSAELKRLRSHGLRPRGGHAEASPFSFTLAGGTREPFAGVVVVGRSPSASAAIGTDYPRLVTVDAAQDISRNHVQFTADRDELVVTDLRSRNGTIVVPPHGDPQRLNPGEPTVVAPGTLIDLGQGVTILLERD